VWDAVKVGAGPDDWLVSCAILTCAPNPLVAQLHNRQAIILTPDQEALWLDSEVTDTAELAPLLQPLGESLMEMHPVSSLVNNVANEGPELLRPPAATVSQVGLAL